MAAKISLLRIVGVLEGTLARTVGPHMLLYTFLKIKKLVRISKSFAHPKFVLMSVIIIKIYDPQLMWHLYRYKSKHAPKIFLDSGAVKQFNKII
jgi:hypothetical protein